MTQLHHIRMYVQYICMYVCMSSISIVIMSLIQLTDLHNSYCISAHCTDTSTVTYSTYVANVALHFYAVLS